MNLLQSIGTSAAMGSAGFVLGHNLVTNGTLNYRISLAALNTMGMLGIALLNQFTFARQPSGLQMFMIGCASGIFSGLINRFYAVPPPAPPAPPIVAALPPLAPKTRKVAIASYSKDI